MFGCIGKTAWEGELVHGTVERSSGTLPKQWWQGYVHIRTQFWCQQCTVQWRCRMCEHTHTHTHTFRWQVIQSISSKFLHIWKTVSVFGHIAVHPQTTHISMTHQVLKQTFLCIWMIGILNFWYEVFSNHLCVSESRFSLAFTASKLTRLWTGRLYMCNFMQRCYCDIIIGCPLSWFAKQSLSMDHFRLLCRWKHVGFA